MRLHVVSDLHLERGAFAWPETGADVVVLAGDVAGGSAGVAYAAEVAGGRPAVYVAGNHEYYGHRLPGLVAELRAAAAGTTVQVLEDDEAVIGGVRFLGCTLWSDFAAAGQEERAASMALCARLLNDYTHIRGEAEAPVRPEETLARHRSSRRWLHERLSAGHPGPTVVVTHHAPLVRVRPASLLHRGLLGGFASDLSPLMGADRTPLWIYGHTHRAVDTHLRGTRVLSNPKGYPQEPVEGFRPELVVEVPVA